jgi:hypothetical protein
MSIPSEDLNPHDEDINAALMFFPLVRASLTVQPRETGEGPKNGFDTQVRAAHKALRSHDRLLKALVRWGNDDPGGFALSGVCDIKERVWFWRTFGEKVSGVDLADEADRGWPSWERTSYSLTDMIVLP